MIFSKTMGIKNGLTRSLLTPSLILNLEQFEQNFHAISDAFPGVLVHFAVKANPDLRVLDTLQRAGAGFEIASPQELLWLLERGVPPNKILCLHPIKAPVFLSQLHHAGVRALAADSLEEIDKIALYAPGSEILVRVDVPNEGSAWDLSGKFGVVPAETIPLLLRAKRQGLVPTGFTMHVGSQCGQLSTWIRALTILKEIWLEARLAGLSLHHISLGGGLPVAYNRPVPTLSEIWQVIRNEVEEFQRAGCTVTIEPGRAIAASAGTLITRVIGVASRGTERWAYIETGTYNGLVEAIETEDRQLYPLTVLHEEEKETRPEVVYQIGGPSCAGADVPFRDVRLPELHVGDRVMVSNVGAYTIACAAPFNGFPVAEVVYFQDLVTTTTQKEWTD